METATSTPTQNPSETAPAAEQTETRAKPADSKVKLSDLFGGDMVPLGEALPNDDERDATPKQFGDDGEGELNGEVEPDAGEPEEETEEETTPAATETAEPEGDAETEQAEETEAKSKPDARREKLLKNMSKESREWAVSLETKLEAEHKRVEELSAKLAQKGKSDLPDNWYEAPEAYRLSPEFQKHAEAYATAENQAAWYAGQLEALEAGEKFDIPSQDGKSTVTVDPKELDDRQRAKAKRWLGEQAAESKNQRERALEKAEQIKSTFTESHKQATGAVEAELEKSFPWLKDEKTPEYKMYKEIMEKRANPIFHGNVMAKASAALLTHMAGREAYIADLEAKLKATGKLSEDRAKRGPIPSGRSGVATNGATKGEAEKKRKLSDLYGSEDGGL